MRKNLPHDGQKVSARRIGVLHSLVLTGDDQQLITRKAKHKTDLTILRSEPHADTRVECTCLTGIPEVAITVAKYAQQTFGMVRLNTN